MIIGVDTGNRMIKTAYAEPFSAGLNHHFDSEPFLTKEFLEKDGQYYTFSLEQNSYKHDKTADDTYYLLTLAAVAREIIIRDEMKRQGKSGFNHDVSLFSAVQKAQKRNSSFNEEISLAVGLPPKDMKKLKNSFQKYFLKDKQEVSFSYYNIPFRITIKEVFVFPQGFSAIIPPDINKEVKQYSQAYIIDIGGYTTDIGRLLQRQFDNNFFESLDFGFIQFFNILKGELREEFGVSKVTITMIEDCLKGTTTGNKDVDNFVSHQADLYSKKIVEQLKEILEFKFYVPVLIGGGTTAFQEYLRKYIEKDDLVIVSDIRANAIGYEIAALAYKRMEKDIDKR